MALTSDQLAELGTYQVLIQTLVAILDKETTIASENRSVNGVDNDNITNLNNTIQSALTAIDDIIAPAP